MYRKIRRSTMALVTGIVIAATSSVADAQMIDTRTGEASTASVATGFGQTFTAPAGATSLQQFSFWLSSGGSGSFASYEAFIMAWDGSEPFGDVLFSSGPGDTPICCPQQRVSFTTGDLAVTSGSTYVAFLLSTAGNLAYRRVRLNGELFDSYAGGAAVFAYDCDDGAVELATSCSWAESNTADVDTEFVAIFAGAAAVPEPASLPLLLTGVAGLVFLRRGRRHA